MSVDLSQLPTKPFDPTIGQAVAERSYLRQEDGEYETREELAARVATGNVQLKFKGIDADMDLIRQAFDYDQQELLQHGEIAIGDYYEIQQEEEDLFHALRSGGLLTAGRHLQHTDNDLIDRVIEIVTNCSDSVLESVKYLLLLDGSGCSRCYDDDVVTTDWAYQPDLTLALKEDHDDFGEMRAGEAWSSEFTSQSDAQELYDELQGTYRTSAEEETLDVVYHEIEDSREGWAKAMELLHDITYRNQQHHEEGKEHEMCADHLILDWSEVRSYGSPIGGMQDRPASGPVPPMKAFLRINQEIGDEPEWEQAIKIDHENAAIVQVGGVRRAARLAMRHWKQDDIFEYIEFKRKLENRYPNGNLYYWSSNNSVGLDEEFWTRVEKVREVLNSVGKEYADFAEKAQIGWTGPDRCYEMDEKPEPWEAFGETYEPEPIKGARYTDFQKEGLQQIADNNNLGIELDNMDIRAANVHLSMTACAFYDETGEPGGINVDKLADNRDGLEELVGKLSNNPSEVVGYDNFELSDTAAERMETIAETLLDKDYAMIANPCAEIALMILGAYCVIGSYSPANVISRYTEIGEWPEEKVEAIFKKLVRLQTRFLMRVNQLPSLYDGEVNRTNRIGVGMCGVHEFYLAQYGLSFHEVVDEEVFDYLNADDKIGHPLSHESMRSDTQHKAIKFWEMLGRVSQEVREEADRYAEELGVNKPHTSTMIAPNGSTGKLDNLTEGAHLPAQRFYLRNNQYNSDDDRVQEKEEEGYLTTELEGQYSGSTVVGFPTKPFIVELAERLGVEDKVVTAREAGAEEQYRWVKLLERYWIRGDNNHPGNQISYTLRFDPEKTDFDNYEENWSTGQSRVRATSVLVEKEKVFDPHGIVNELTDEDVPESGPYSYLPQQPIPKEVYDELVRRIESDEDDPKTVEDVSREHVECEGGGCPVTF